MCRSHLAISDARLLQYPRSQFARLRARDLGLLRILWRSTGAWRETKILHRRIRDVEDKTIVRLIVIENRHEPIHSLLHKSDLLGLDFSRRAFSPLR